MEFYTFESNVCPDGKNEFEVEIEVSYTCKPPAHEVEDVTLVKCNRLGEQVNGVSIMHLLKQADFDRLVEEGFEGILDSLKS